MNKRFNFEDYVEKTLGLKEVDEIYCIPYQSNSCKNYSCTKQHIKLATAVVCKHWLRGLCKKGDKCEFIHEYILDKMPECHFFSEFGTCGNPECMFVHINPDSVSKECAWYNRGFCRHGNACKHKHVRRNLCYNYFVGFCIKGPECKLGHPKFVLLANEVKADDVINKSINLVRETH